MSSTTADYIIIGVLVMCLMALGIFWLVRSSLTCDYTAHSVYIPSKYVSHIDPVTKERHYHWTEARTAVFVLCDKGAE